MEKRPLKRKIITTKPKSQVPKRFLKKMEKNMRRREKIKGMFNPPVPVPEGEGDDFGGDDDGYEMVGEDYGAEEAGDGDDDEYVSDD